MSVTLAKHGPLDGIYRRRQANTSNVGGWHMAQHIAGEAAEKDALANAALLADWSHVTKFSIRGTQAAIAVSALNDQAPLMHPGQCHSLEDGLLFRLTPDEFFLVGEPANRSAWIQQLDEPGITFIDQTGGMGCFALAGPRRQEVWERSSAMNLEPFAFATGTVLQTTVHAVPAILYRSNAFDLVLSPRELAEFLFEALLDVGTTVDLQPGGLAVFPVRWR